MTRQDEALLAVWQLQRALGIPANDRVFTIPELNPASPAIDTFEADLAVIRKCMERA